MYKYIGFTEIICIIYLLLFKFRCAILTVKLFEFYLQAWPISLRLTKGEVLNSSLNIALVSRTIHPKQKRELKMKMNK